MEEKIQTRTHKINLQNRTAGSITGVKDVISFDVNEVVLATEQGTLTIKGKELHVNRLTLEKGEVDIDGMVDSLTYSDNGSYGKSSESLISRLFK